MLVSVNCFGVLLMGFQLFGGCRGSASGFSTPRIGRVEVRESGSSARVPQFWTCSGFAVLDVLGLRSSGHVRGSAVVEGTRLANTTARQGTRTTPTRHAAVILPPNNECAAEVQQKRAILSEFCCTLSGRLRGAAFLFRNPATSRSLTIPLKDERTGT